MQQAWIARTTLSLVSALAIASGCSRPDEVLSPVRLADGANRALQGEDPFYYFFKEKIPLTTDPTELIVQATAGTTAQQLQTSVAQLGLTTSALTPFVQQNGYWSVRIAPTLRFATTDAAAIAMRSLPAVLFAEPVYRLQSDGTSIQFLNRLVVRFLSGISSAQVDSFAKALALTLERPPRPDSAFFEYLFTLPAGAGRALHVAASASESPIVAWADLDSYSGSAGPTYVPTDPYYGLQFHLKNATTYNGVRVDDNVEQAWDLTTGAGIKVAIIDDGVDVLHGNSGGGYAGDLIGRFAGTMAYDAVGYPTCSGDPLHPQGDDTHGTAIAGIIAATHNNAVGVAGIAPGVTLEVVRWLCNSYGNPRKLASATQLANGINFAWQSATADVISNSWQWGPHVTQIQAAIDQATTLGRNGKGAVVVFSSSNDYPAPIPFPNNLPNVFTVGAITRSGLRAAYSQTGAALDVVAPSGATQAPCIGEVVTLDRYGSPGCNDGPNGDISFTQSFSGTSAAAPQAAAVAALVLSREPALTEAQVRSRLCLMADPWGSANDFGCGKINAYYAVNGRPLTASITGPSPVKAHQTCSWAGNATGGIGGYSYSWKVNGQPVGSDQTLEYANTGSAFTLQLTVSDGYQPPHLKTTSKNVTISAGAPNCQL